MSGRHFLACVLFVFLFSAFTTACFAQASVEVFYTQQNTNILTYNVDPTTLQATQVGQPLALAGSPGVVQLIPAPDDHFVYVVSGDDANDASLSVYATDLSGAPQAPPLQTFAAGGLSEFAVGPNGKFAYLFTYTVSSQAEYSYVMRLFTIDATTGKLTESTQPQAKFAPSSYCAPAFAGFYPDASQIELSLGCNYPDAQDVTVYARSINPRTGDLGQPVGIFAYSNNNAPLAYDEVLLDSRSINDLHVVNFQPSVRIYPLEPRPTKPLINCTSSMLAACGEAGSFSQDPSGQYLLMSIPSGIEIVKVDFENKQIVDTGSSIQQQPYFSGDDSILYGASYAGLGENGTVQVYGFNPNTGGLTTGGLISVEATFWNLFTAVRR